MQAKKTFLKKLIPLLLSVGATLLLAQSSLSARAPKHWGGTQQAPTISKVEQMMQLNRAVRAGETSAVAVSNLTCENGTAGPYPCHNVDLLAFVPTNALVGGTSADIWGWTDSLTGKEYAITSHSNSTSFVDISDPVNPEFLGYIPAPVPNILWRDVKVYNNHAYIVGDGDFVTPHGLQIFDLTQLRGITTPTIFEQSARFMGVNNSHNIAINDASGVAYLVGSSRCSAGLFMLDLASDPLNPTELGCFSDDGYTHDVQCVNYAGPDAEHQGSEICVAANEDTLTIVDVTDKANPVQLSRQGYSGSSYTHQGWFTEDQAYFISNDELDEQDFGHNTHSYIWDVRDLENPVLINTHVGATSSIDHNLYIHDNFVYESNYTSGLSILDASDIANGNLTEVAYFDTHPASDVAQFAGTWSNYPFFESGVVIVSNIEDGLYILRPHLPGDEDPNDPPPPAGGGFATGSGWLADNNGAKLNFHVRVRDQGKHFEGELRIRDNSADASIEAKKDDVIAIGALTEACGPVSPSPNAIEYHTNGTYNGAAATFRVCFEDNGEGENSADDLFYATCLTGCRYSTDQTAADAGLDGGNIKIHQAPTTSSSQESSMVGSSSSEAAVLTLDPLLMSSAETGALLPLSVMAVDVGGNAIADVSVSLVQTHANGSTEMVTAVTNLSGIALFQLPARSGTTEYIASGDGLTSNAILIRGVTP